MSVNNTVARTRLTSIAAWSDSTCSDVHEYASTYLPSGACVSGS